MENLYSVVVDGLSFRPQKNDKSFWFCTRYGNH